MGLQIIGCAKMRNNILITGLVSILKQEGLNVYTKKEYGNNIIFIEENGVEKLRLYIKTSSIDKSFWGLTKSRIDRLQSEITTCDYKVILISNDCSITLSSDEVAKMLLSMNVVDDGDYKIKEEHLAQAWIIQKSIYGFLKNSNNQGDKGKISLELDAKIKFDIDTKTNSLHSISMIPVLNKIKKNEEEFIIHTITETQNKFGILTLGAKNSIGALIPVQEEIRLIFNGKAYTNKPIITHKTVKGRIDGLTDFYTNTPELTVGTKLKVKFDYEKKILELKSIK